jgi:DNA-dependent RNA polymerase auxiliary subunit epsilon
MDEYRLSIGNFFETKALAEQHLAYLKALTEVRNFIKKEGLGKEFVDGDDNDFIAYHKERKMFRSSNWCTCNICPPLGYLISSEACNRVIAEQLENLKIIYGVK